MRNQVILASGSPVRAALLEAAGVDFDVAPARVDEAAMKRAFLAEGARPREIADALADLKAARVSARAPDALVLGADQVLVLEGKLLDKPADLDEAREHLRELRGKKHELLSAAVIYEASRPVWRSIGTATLAMRAFSDDFLEAYLAKNGDSLLGSVGAYRLEAGGTVLFDRVEGDYFSVLGLPLLQVLSYLRVRGIMPE